MATREFTGRHAAILFVSAFAVIIGVNLVLAFSAISTFPGLEVKNSYVASQEFDRRRAGQVALGWTVTARADGDRVVLRIADPTGVPVRVARIDAVLGRATHVRDDQPMSFVFNGADYTAPARIAPGNWNLRMVAVSEDGVEFRQRVVLDVQG